MRLELGGKRPVPRRGQHAGSRACSQTKWWSMRGWPPGVIARGCDGASAKTRKGGWAACMHGRKPRRDWAAPFSPTTPTSRPPLPKRPMLALALARRRIFQLPARAALLCRGYVAAPPPGLDKGEENIWRKLSEKFEPTALAVQDVSGMYCLTYEEYRGN